MRKILTIILLHLFFSTAMASQQKDILYGLAKNYAVEMWNQGQNGNPSLAMDARAYDFYFKHLFDTYSLVFKQVEASADKEKFYELYFKVCDILKWKTEHKEYSHFKKYLKLKQKMEKMAPAEQ